MTTGFRKFALSLAVLSFAYAPHISYGAPLNSSGWDSACDEEIMIDMEKRAWMMMQREVEANAFFIKKPDSVLELTCYDQQVGALAQLGDWFSEQNIDGSSRVNNLNDAITDAVQNAMETYLNASFSYPNNSSRSGIGSTGTLRLSGGYSAQEFVPTTTGMGSFNCSYMKSVWENNVCDNAHMGSLFRRMVNFGGDGADAPTADLRDELLWYTCHATGDDINDVWLERYQDSSTVVNPEFDSIQTNFIYTLPLQAGRGTSGQSLGGGNGLDNLANMLCSGGVCVTDKCQPPIATGLTVVSSGRPFGFPDAVCPNPGCTIGFVNGAAGTAAAGALSDLRCDPADLPSP